MVLERILLQTIKFDLQVEHPYQFLLKYAKQLKGKQIAGIAAWQHVEIISYSIIFSALREVIAKQIKKGNVAVWKAFLMLLQINRNVNILYHSVGEVSALEILHLRAKSVLIQGLAVLWIVCFLCMETVSKYKKVQTVVRLGGYHMQARSSPLCNLQLSLGGLARSLRRNRDQNADSQLGIDTLIPAPPPSLMEPFMQSSCIETKILYVTCYQKKDERTGCNLSQYRCVCTCAHKQFFENCLCTWLPVQL